MDTDLRPRLRPLTGRAVVLGGEPWIALADPLGVARPARGAGSPSASREDVHLAARAHAIARRFDGTRTPADVAREWGAVGGGALSAAEVHALAAELSERGLLDDARFRELAREQWRAFKSSPERPFVGAGSDYEQAPIDLRIRVAGLVADDWDMPATPDVFGLITPACSFARAGRLYARSYAALRHVGGSFVRVLLLGQSRAPLETPLVALDRPFATPFGALACDLEGVRALGIEAGFEELAHRGALELERQVLFLRLLFPKLAIVPVLAAAKDPREDAGAAELSLAALARVQALPGRTLFVCASDLEHRDTAPDAAGLAALREQDRRCIEHATACSAEGFLEHAGPGARASSSFATWLFLRLAAWTREHRPAYAVRDGDPGAGRAQLAGTTLGYQQLAGSPFVSAASVLFH